MPFALYVILTGILLLPVSVMGKAPGSIKAQQSLSNKSSVRSSSSVTTQTAPDSTGYLLYYQPLFEFPQTQAQAYLVEVRKILAQNHAMDLEKIIAVDGDTTACRKPKDLACIQALYPKSKCVPRNKVPSQYCHQTSSNHANDFFDESVFSRIEWNKLALQINAYCNVNKNPVCPTLARHQDQYMQKYSQLIRTQREHRIKAMKESQ